MRSGGMDRLAGLQKTRTPKATAVLLFLAVVCLTLLIVCSPPGALAERDARQIVKDAIEYWRGESSYTEAEMTVHRPDWQRRSSLNSWTKGSELTLVRFTEPKKDAGNASLTIDEEVWTYSPKTNRVIKIPASMKSQSWMGSDFSYQDLSKDDEIIDKYDHRIIGSEEQDGKKVVIIESIPHETAPIVWGREILAIREDHIVVKHEFYDQAMKLVKKLTAREIGPLGGRTYPIRIRMEDAEQEGHWTEVVHRKAEFGIDTPRSFFTVSSLQNPRR